MSRNRLLALSTFVLVASGATVFACSSGDDGFNDGGADAKADQTSNKDSGSDAGKDGSMFGDSGQDATIQDSGNDATTSDATADATGNDAADGGAEDAGDASDDGATTDASMDAGAVTTFMVVRVNGDVDAGADAGLSSTSTQVFVEERNISDGSLVRTLAMPTTMNGSNQPLTMSGSATSEGALTRSADGHYVVLAGFAAATGVANVAKTGSLDGGVLRVVARVDKNGNVDTTTEVAAFDQGDIRGAATNDGTAFWATGTVNSDAGDTFAGVQYVALGSTGAATNITSVPYNTRVPGVYGGQLYITSALTPNNGVSAVGMNLPTTSGQTSTVLAGFAGDSGSPYGFSMLDLDGSVTGIDTLYVADDSAQNKGGGVQKWVYNGTTWSLATTFTDGITTGCRGVTAMVSGNDVVVLATSTSTSGNVVVKWTDDGQNLTPTGTVIATAPTNTAFRGIAIAPQ